MNIEEINKILEETPDKAEWSSTTSLKFKKDLVEFDGMWSSSLTDSATKGKPDNSSLDLFEGLLRGFSDFYYYSDRKKITRMFNR